MKRLIAILAMALGLMIEIGSAQAEENKELRIADDITKETIVGPGSIQVITQCH